MRYRKKRWKKTDEIASLKSQPQSSFYLISLHKKGTIHITHKHDRRRRARQGEELRSWVSSLMYFSSGLLWQFVGFLCLDEMRFAKLWEENSDAICCSRQLLSGRAARCWHLGYLGLLDIILTTKLGIITSCVCIWHEVIDSIRDSSHEGLIF